jgi:uncharacterized membrane protein
LPCSTANGNCGSSPCSDCAPGQGGITPDSSCPSGYTYSTSTYSTSTYSTSTYSTSTYSTSTYSTMCSKLCI